MKRIDEQKTKQLLQDLPEWKIVDGKLHKSFKGLSVLQISELLHGIVDEANRVDHHPEVYWAYDNLRVGLSTHDVGGISEKDFAFAKAVEKLLLSVDRQ